MCRQVLLAALAVLAAQLTGDKLQEQGSAGLSSHRPWSFHKQTLGLVAKNMIFGDLPVLVCSLHSTCATMHTLLFSPSCLAAP